MVVIQVLGSVMLVAS